jgi:hypothetical protein
MSADKCYYVEYKRKNDHSTHCGWYPGYSESDVLNLVAARDPEFDRLVKIQIENESWDKWFKTESKRRTGWS